MKIKSGSDYSLAIAKDAWALVPPDSDLKPWDYLPELDTSKSYEAFKEYRDMGLSRSLDKVRQLLSKAAGYVGQLERWSRTHFWPARVQAFDQYIDQQQQAALVKKEVTSHTQKLQQYRAKIETMGWTAISAAQDGYEVVQELIQGLKELSPEKKRELKTPDIRNIAMASTTCAEKGLQLLHDALAVGQLLDQLQTLDDTVEVSAEEIT
jgi:hypothetical protein